MAVETLDLFPTEIKEETPGVTAWVNPQNILTPDATTTTVIGGNTGHLAGLRLAGFNAATLLGEGVKITKVEAVYKIRQVGKETGNPICGVDVKTGATFRPEMTEIEGVAVPTVLTEVVLDITDAGAITGWTLQELEDSAPLYLDPRCRNNFAGAQTEFEYQYACIRVTFERPTPGSTILSREDLMTEANPEEFWGDESNSASSLADFELVEGGPTVDTRRKCNGEAPIPKGRKLLAGPGKHAPEDVDEERTEAGHNERRYGEAHSGFGGNEGTFFLFKPGSHHITWVSMYLDPDFPINTEQFQTLLQMKQAEPYTDTEYGSPILEIEARLGQFQLISQPQQEKEPLWTCPASVGRVVRFRVEVIYRGREESPGGLINIQVDDRDTEPADFVAQHSSGWISHQTLTQAIGAQEGFNWKLANGQVFESHLRLGIYRRELGIENYSVLSNIQVETVVPGGPEPEPENERELSPKAMQTNLYPDPGFESASLSYAFREVASGVTDGTRVVTDKVEATEPNYGPVIDGDYSLQVEAEFNSATGTLISVGWRLPTVAAQVWSAGVWSAFSTLKMQSQLGLGFQNAEGENLEVSGAAKGTPENTIPELLIVEGLVAPLESAFVVVRLSLLAEEGIAGATTFDNVLLVEGPQTPTHPIDGDRGGMDWEGARFMSPSYELGEAPTTPEWKKWTPPYLWAPKALAPELT